MADSYTGRDIQVLKGLAPVRLRPGMFIGNTSSTGLHHLFTEALDNAVDEALNGYCTRIHITIGTDNTITVTDNGRGIPVDKHPQSRKNTLETIMTSLHSGGKFSTKSYKVSGGLHGVGISVVNALSEFMRVISRRDGTIWQQEFSRGKRKSKLLNLGPTKERGTTIMFRPDPDIFKDIRFDPHIIKEQAKAKAFLTRGLAVIVEDQVGDSTERFFFEEGIKNYLSDLVANKEIITEEPFYINYENDLRLELALWWTMSSERTIYSYANSVYTSGGGSHENGFRHGIVRALREYMARKNSLARKVKTVTAEDVREGLVAVLSVFVSGNLEFQGQTKERLNSDIQPQVESVVKDAFENYLFHNGSAAEAIVDRVLLAAQAREASRQARKSVRRKRSSKRLTLPGKLADCTSNRLEENELFIVEGDSAGGSSKQARDRRFQAVLPLRGKILNVEQASAERIRKNREIQDLIQCIGTGAGNQFDYRGLRYGKIFINCDADVDGFHISTLLLTFFFRYMPELIEKGHIFLAQPPLYRIQARDGKKRSVHYVYLEEEKEELLAKLSARKVSIQRFKGLGEMNAAELKETTMDPQKRRALQVTIEDAERTNETFETLMGREPAKRYAFIQENATFVRDIDA
ncbi:MAG: type IIA DNA topoisomerase subunit B [Deltaproteobacteria bacterium]|nr:type IIA DNA topoisomerase subunit B [Deltaproteobacteria bacterium]MBW2070314.1 type IIA DNA topoisomerase subunit B [Deltaproteobacteria bacterium]